MWACQHYRWRNPRSWVSSGGLGTMGFGLPSAIGAKVAAPHKTVVDIDGDASFSMTAMELATASQYNIGVKVLILNNEFQGMVLQWQDLFYNKRYSGTPMTNPDFVALAEAMHCKAIRCTSVEDLPRAMKEFMEYDGDKPILLECEVTKNEHVFPSRSIYPEWLPPSFGSFADSLSITSGRRWQGPPRADRPPSPPGGDRDGRRLQVKTYLYSVLLLASEPPSLSYFRTISAFFFPLPPFISCPFLGLRTYVLRSFISLYVNQKISFHLKRNRERPELQAKKKLITSQQTKDACESCIESEGRDKEKRKSKTAKECGPKKK